MPVKTSGAPKEMRLAYVAAGDATNDTFYYYIPTEYYTRTGIQFEWTAGAGGGTAIVTFEASCMGIQYGTTPYDYTTLTYRDVTNATFGVASYTDDFQVIDNTGRFSCFTYVRVKLVVANKDGATTWSLFSRQMS